jgi:restriction endonuclease S subunit
LPEFYWCLTQSKEYWAQREQLISGGGQPQLNANALKLLEIPLPPLEEQRRIVAEIEGYQQVINGARQILTAYQPSFDLNPDWEMVALGEVCRLYQPKTITGRDLVENGPYVVFGANGVIGRYTEFNHEHPEVVITCRGATCGTINMTTEKCWITGNAMVATPADGRVEKQFLFYLLKSTDFSSTITGSAQPQITRESLSPLEIPLPPLPEQRQIVAELDAEAAEVAAVRALIPRTEAKIQRVLARVWGTGAAS